jgi:hypothetical protein
LEDFKRALGRVQTDYEFYIQCQSDPAVALAGYDLSRDERSALSDPAMLAEVLERGIGIDQLRFTITISGRHDWVNRSPRRKVVGDDDVTIERAVADVKQATADDKRAQAVLRLMERIG